MAAYMVEIKIDDDAIQYKVVVASDTSQAEQFIRNSESAANAVTLGKKLSESEIEELGLSGKPDGHIEPWMPPNG